MSEEKKFNGPKKPFKYFNQPANPKRPKIIDGTTAKVRIEKRTAAANFDFSLAYSVRYKAVIVPNGTAAIDITTTIIS